MSGTCVCVCVCQTDLGVAVDGSVMEWSIVLQASHVHVGPGVQQLPRHVTPAVITRFMQRRPACNITVMPATTIAAAWLGLRTGNWEVAGPTPGRSTVR